MKLGIKLEIGLQLKFFVDHVLWVMWFGRHHSCLTSPSFFPNTTMPQVSRHSSVQNLCCPFWGCPRTFRSQAGCTNHVHSVHPRVNRHRQAIQPDTEIPASPTSSRSSPQLPNINPFPDDSESSEPAEHQFPAPEPPPVVPQCKMYHPFLNDKFFSSFLFAFLSRSSVYC